MAGKLELERDSPDRGAARNLRARIAELPGSHPSAAGYASDRVPARERADSDAPGGAAADRTWAGDVRVTADRCAHILEGDQNGNGGHRHGAGQPGKTEFPAEWDDDHVIDAVLAVARRPDQAPERQSWNERWRVSGKHEDVEIVAIVESSGQIWTAWPREGSPGVVKNPVEET